MSPLFSWQGVVPALPKDVNINDEQAHLGVHLRRLRKPAHFFRKGWNSTRPHRQWPHRVHPLYLKFGLAHIPTDGLLCLGVYSAPSEDCSQRFPHKLCHAARAYYFRSTAGCPQSDPWGIHTAGKQHQTGLGGPWLRATMDEGGDNLLLALLFRYLCFTPC